jgi:hypothetical protein
MYFIRWIISRLVRLEVIGNGLDDVNWYSYLLINMVDTLDHLTSVNQYPLNCSNDHLTSVNQYPLNCFKCIKNNSVEKQQLGREMLHHVSSIKNS